jgi:signal transduction histidine kinase
MRRAPKDCTILMIDDEPANLDLLEAFLLGEGYHALLRSSDAREAAPLFERHAPDLVLLDLHMPFKDGFAVLEELRALTPPDEYRPVLILTADVTPEAKERALASGARDFLTKPFDIVEVLLRVHNLLETRVLHEHQCAERRRAEALAAENARLFAEAQQATLARDRMLSVVAHDLRNPLALVAMHAEMLCELLSPRADAYQREMADSIQQATVRMQRLVEDLLDVSRIEHGSFALVLGEVDLAELMDETSHLLRPTADAHGVALEFGVAGMPPRVAADGARLLQVLANLVGNAVKFTPAGGRVVVRCEENGVELRFSVSDTGPGISAEQLPHLFDAFWQAQHSDRRGVGLGLWIARSLVEAHGGRIWVESGEGRGTTFHFTVPRAAPVAAAVPVAAGAARCPA